MGESFEEVLDDVFGAVAESRAQHVAIRISWRLG